MELISVINSLHKNIVILRVQLLYKKNLQCATRDYRFCFMLYLMLFNDEQYQY